MAGRSTGDIFDFSGMTDDELYDVVVQELREHPENRKPAGSGRKCR